MGLMDIFKELLSDSIERESIKAEEMAQDTRRYFISVLGMDKRTHSDIDRLLASNLDAQRYLAEGRFHEDFHFYKLFPLSSQLYMLKIHALFSAGNVLIQESIFQLFKKSQRSLFKMRESAGMLSLEQLGKKMNATECILYLPAMVYYEVMHDMVIERTKFSEHILKATKDQKREVQLLNKPESYTTDFKKAAQQLFVNVTGIKLRDRIAYTDIIEGLIVKQRTLDISYKNEYKLVENLLRDSGLLTIFMFHDTYYDSSDFYRFFKRILPRYNRTLNEQDLDKIAQLFYLHLLFTGLIKEIHARQSEQKVSLHYELNELSLHAELNARERELTKAHEREIEGKNNEIKRLMYQLEVQQDAISYLEREQHRKEKELQQQASQLEELQALREFLYVSMQEQEQPIEEPSSYQPTTATGAYFGGHPAVIKRIKPLLPNFRFISPDELAVDLSRLKTMDVICFDTTYNNHPAYQRMKEYRGTVPTYYIHKHTSIADMLAFIQQSMEQKSLT